MIEKILLANSKYKLFDNAGHITVALSGGADSVALLHALCSIKEQFGFSLTAAHLNHSIRGDEANRDAAFSEQFAKELSVPFVLGIKDIPAAAKETGESIETAARRVRYDFLQETSNGLIATAHTASDCVETVLHNMSRGSSLDGICGIPAKRDNIIRPLIFVTRKEIEEYCQKNNLSYVTDSTNLETDYTRNKIRHKIVPVLSEINSKAEENISLLCEGLKTDAEYLKQEVEKLFFEVFRDECLDAEKLKEQHPALVSRVIARFVQTRTGIIADRKHILNIMELLDGKNSGVSLSGNMTAVINYSKLVIQTKEPKSSFSFLVREDLSNDSSLILKLKNRESIEFLENINSLLLYSAVDYDKIQGRLTVRSRIESDKICLVKRNVTKTLKKLFIEDKIEKTKRDKINVLADEKGVVWVEGYGADKRTAVTDKTKTILLIENKKA